MINIWLVEDEITIADPLIYTLEREHYHVRWFDCGMPMLKAIKKHKPNLLILDVGLPDIIGFDLAKQVLNDDDIPVIFLTARSEEIDRIVGLEIGADDYIIKPFSLREVLARVKAVLRRSNKQSSKAKVIQCGALTLNEDSTLIRYYDMPLNLTRYEYLLLKTFINAPNRIFSRTQLMEIVWQDNLETMERTIDTHIKTIRQKLLLINSSSKQPIQTHRGLGYSLSIL